MKQNDIRLKIILNIAVMKMMIKLQKIELSGDCESASTENRSSEKKKIAL